MEFKFIENESEYPNCKYLLRAYGNKKGNLIGTYESIKKNCIEKKEYCLVEKNTFKLQFENVLVKTRE